MAFKRTGVDSEPSSAAQSRASRSEPGSWIESVAEGLIERRREGDRASSEWLRLQSRRIEWQLEQGERIAGRQARIRPSASGDGG